MHLHITVYPREFYNRKKFLIDNIFYIITLNNNNGSIRSHITLKCTGKNNITLKLFKKNNYLFIGSSIVCNFCIENSILLLFNLRSFASDLFNRYFHW